MGTQLPLWTDLPEITDTKEIAFQPIRTPLWTSNKAQLISKYLYYFVLITKHGIYIDGFAAPQEPEQENSWAAKLVLDTQPKKFHLREYWLCELDPVRARFLEELEEITSDRRKTRIKILVGDFNKEVHKILKDGSIKEKTAAFCLLDQRTFECEWATVETLATHKRNGHKIEQFYFLATGWLDRAFSGLTVNTHKAEKWWGGPGWGDLRSMDGNRRARIFADRFKKDLGYTYATPWPIFEKGNTGRVMYHMIHATDHPEAPKIMARAYRKATSAPEPIEQLELELRQLVKELPSELGVELPAYQPKS